MQIKYQIEYLDHIEYIYITEGNSKIKLHKTVYKMLLSAGRSV